MECKTIEKQPCSVYSSPHLPKILTCWSRASDFADSCGNNLCTEIPAAFAPFPPTQGGQCYADSRHDVSLCMQVLLANPTTEIISAIKLETGSPAARYMRFEALCLSDLCSRVARTCMHLHALNAGCKTRWLIQVPFTRSRHHVASVEFVQETCR